MITGFVFGAVFAYLSVVVAAVLFMDRIVMWYGQRKMKKMMNGVLPEQ